MASTVQTGGGSGVDLSDLTSGERFLIGILGQKIYMDHAYGQGGDFYALQLPYNVILDMSNVNSITITKSITRKGDIILEVFGSGMYYYGPETTTFNPSNGNIKVMLDPTECPGHCEFTITSFTTADGKVHTANNLNY